MIDTPLFHGRLVKLVAPDPEKDARFLARWSHDSEYLRLFDAAPARPRPVEEYQEKLEKQASKADEISFMITPLSPAAEQPIGIVELDGIQWPHQTAWVGIGLGEKEYWVWYGRHAGGPTLWVHGAGPTPYLDHRLRVQQTRYSGL